MNDQYHFANSGTGTHSPVEGLASYGNISKTHYMYSIQRELAKLARQQAQQSTVAGMAPETSTIPSTSAFQQQVNPTQEHVPNLPPAAISGNASFLPGASIPLSPEENNFNWLLNGSYNMFQTGDNFDVPVSTGIPPYDDISAMLNWQWPLEDSSSL